VAGAKIGDSYLQSNCSKKGFRCVAQETERLPDKYKVSSSKPSTAKKEKIAQFLVVIHRLRRCFCLLAVVELEPRAFTWSHSTCLCL
jgi:hypothetical protein